MNKPVEIIAIVEGKTEQIFIQDILVPHLCKKAFISFPLLHLSQGKKVEILNGLESEMILNVISNSVAILT